MNNTAIQISSPDPQYRLSYGWAASPFGDMLAVWASEKLMALAFAAKEERDCVFADVAARMPDALGVRDDELAKNLAAQIFTPRFGATSLPIPLALAGSAFDQRVWQELQTIPPGETRTYTDIANQIERPKAVRAVASAIGRNPVAWLVPCHRVLRKDGSLGGYHWGLDCKKKMLAFEAGL